MAYEEMEWNKPLTQEEKLEIAEEQNIKMRRLDEIDIEKAGLSDEAKQLKSDVKDLNKKYLVGNTIKINAKVVKNHDDGIVELLHPETSEIIGTRELEENDNQQDFDDMVDDDVQRTEEVVEEMEMEEELV